jgi:aminopeptidase N
MARFEYVTGTDPYVPDHGDSSYGVVHYALALRYRPDSNRLDGKAELTCRAVAPMTSASLDLHQLQVAKVTSSGVSVARGGPPNRKLLVTFKTAAKAGTDFKLRVRYSGRPGTVPSATLGEAGWEELADGAIVAAQPHGAPAWFPCNDRPDSKATYSFEVSVPAQYHVAASGDLVEHKRSGSAVTFWYEQRAPMACYLAAVQVGRYVVHELDSTVPIKVVAPSDVTGAGYDGSFGRQPEMMNFFVDRFGPYPFEGYTSVITDDVLEIPLESQSLATFGRNFATGDWHSVRLVAHEMAHQWFGNAVTLTTWSDIWLHEGFACYAEWLWSQECGVRSATSWAQHYYERLRQLPQDLQLSDPGPELMFDDRVYKRGALTLHALRTTVGDEAFFNILRTWVSTHSGGSVTTAQFVELCNELTGKDLSAMFASWLDALPLPALPA